MPGALAGCALLPPSAPGGEGRQDTVSKGRGQQQPEWESCNEGLLQCATVEARSTGTIPSASRSLSRSSSARPRATSSARSSSTRAAPDCPGWTTTGYHPRGATGIAVKEHYDVIAWDPRGVGGSTAVECLDTTSMDDYLYGAPSAGAGRGSDEWIAAETSAQAAFGKSCAENTGDLLANVDTASTLRDLDMLRQITGDEKLNYLGNLYGTYVGALYAEMYPEKVGRMVLDGGYDPTVTSAEIDLAQATGMERLLRSYPESCLAASDCPLSGTPEAAMQQIRTVLDTGWRRRPARPPTAGR
nr:alpha/beta fold hydrolase [Leucobacter sp. wl10]